MPSSLTSYLAGLGTAGIAVVLGFGGALLVSASKPSPQPAPSRIERQAKSPSIDTVSKQVAEFPSHADPVTITPALFASNSAAEHAADTAPTTAASSASEVAPSSVAETAKGNQATADRSSAASYSSSPAVSASEPAQSRDVSSPQNVASIADAKRRREMELKNARRAREENRMIAERKKERQEIAAAVSAVRQMLRDQRYRSEDAPERSFNMGFAND